MDINGKNEVFINVSKYIPAKKSKVNSTPLPLARHYVVRHKIP